METYFATHKILNPWKEYESELFVKPIGELNLVQTNFDEREPPPVEATCQMMKLGKAPGLDGITAESIRFSEPTVAQCLHKLYVRIWETNEWSNAWKRFEFVIH